MTAEAVIVPCAACGALNRIPTARLRDRPICADCRAILVGGSPPDLDARSFHRLTTRSDLPVVVDFWASWCGPCRTMAPHFEHASAALADVALLAKLDTENHRDVAAHFEVRSIPTIIAFHRGTVLERHSGAMPGDRIEAWVRSVVARA